MSFSVTPFVGVWIETLQEANVRKANAVTPFVGVWIETNLGRGDLTSYGVTPFVGVWIETYTQSNPATKQESHPSWVCGLKLVLARIWFITHICHTLRGCVD